MDTDDQYMVVDDEDSGIGFSIKVTSLKELSDELQELMLKRSIEFEIARARKSEKSLVDFMKHLSREDKTSRRVWESAFAAVMALSIEVGTALCLCLAEFLFVVASEGEEVVKQYQDYFKSVLLSMVLSKNENSLVAITKTLVVLAFAEFELVEIGVLSRETLEEHVRHSIYDEEGLDRKEMSIREVEFDDVFNKFVKHLA